MSTIVKSLMFTMLAGSHLACMPAEEVSLKNESSGTAQSSDLQLKDKIYEVTTDQGDLADFHAFFEAGGVIFIKYGAVWCPPCRQFDSSVMPTLAKRTRDHRIMIVNVDIDQLKRLPKTSRDILSKFQAARTIPNAALVSKGKSEKKFASLSSSQRQADALIRSFQPFKEQSESALRSINEQAAQPNDDNNPVPPKSTQTDSLWTTPDEMSKKSQVKLGSQNFHIARNGQGDPIQLYVNFGRAINIDRVDDFQVDGISYKVIKSENRVIGLTECRDDSCKEVLLN